MHSNSLNESRRGDRSIKDRFDLTLERIRRHYLEIDDNPLVSVLTEDTGFFALFGAGQDGFDNYLEYFHLQDLWDGTSIQWFDDFDGSMWDFSVAPLPDSAEAYRRYLDRVAAFVSARNARIAAWLDVR